MRQFHLYAYEFTGLWHVSVSVVDTDENQERVRYNVYTGDMGIMDDESPEFQAVQVLSQVARDLMDGMSHSEAAAVLKQ